MRKVREFFKSLLATCGICYGMGVLETSNGDTVSCPSCKGKGLK